MNTPQKQRKLIHEQLSTISSNLLNIRDAFKYGVEDHDKLVGRIGGEANDLNHLIDELKRLEEE